MCSSLVVKITMKEISFCVQIFSSGLGANEGSALQLILIIELIQTDFLAHTIEISLTSDHFHIKMKNLIMISLYQFEKSENEIKDL